MIRIYGISLDSLSDTADEMLTALPTAIAETWKRQHPSLREENTTKTSLAGVWLLWHAMPDARLAYTADGKPFLVEQNVSIGITHTKTHAFCAISDSEDAIGLDAESLGRIKSDRLESLSKRWFTESEQKRLQAEPSEEIFLDIWTKKESLVKLTGEGLRALREADTEAPPKGILFASYRHDNTILSLAYPQEEEPSSEIIFF